MRRELLRAEVVYNGLGTPRPDGAIVLQEGSGGPRIVAVEGYQSARSGFPDAAVREVGFALSPPPVNAHTHLDLSTMPYSPGPYEVFIEAVVRHHRSGGRSLAAAEAGVEALLATGIGVVGDIVALDEVMRFLLAHPRLTGVAYWEVIEPDPEAADRVLAATEERLRMYRRLERPGGVRVGLSPHTPHTVSAPLLRRLAALAIREGLPLQIHLAESPSEVAYHRDGSGPFGDLLAGYASDWCPSGLTPVGYLRSLGVLEARPTLVHMIQVVDEDVREVQRAGCVVIHCPRSNKALECDRFPWALYARHGVTVAFGTDSLGSSPSLSIEQEVAFARSWHGAEASPLGLVRAAVKGGYRALRLTPPRLVRGDPAEGVYIWGQPC